MMQDEDVKAALAALDLAVHDAWRFFRLLDANGSGAVTEDEFVQGCLRLRGPARTFDVASLSEENLRMKTKLTNLEEQEMFIQQLLNHLRIEVMQVGKVAAQAKQAVEEATFARAEESKKPSGTFGSIQKTATGWDIGGAGAIGSGERGATGFTGDDGCEVSFPTSLETSSWTGWKPWTCPHCWINAAKSAVAKAILLLASWSAVQSALFV